MGNFTNRLNGYKTTDMKKPFKETRFGNFFNKVLAPIFRGVVKTIPFGTVIVEVTENLLKKEDKKKPHHYLSIVIQFIVIAAIVYAFLSKQITIEQVLYYLNYVDPTQSPTPIP